MIQEYSCRVRPVLTDLTMCLRFTACVLLSYTGFHKGLSFALVLSYGEEPTCALVFVYITNVPQKRTLHGAVNLYEVHVPVGNGA